MANIVTCSVPHTGTWFTIRLFTNAGMAETNLLPSKIEDNHIFHGHMLKGTQVHAALRLAKEMPLVCPLRHPYRVEESWRRRGKDIIDMIECFQIYMKDFLPLAPYIVPVDSPRREGYIELMRRELGIDLKHDGEVINGKKGTHDLSLDDCSPSLPVRDLVGEMRPFLSEYY